MSSANDKDFYIIDGQQRLVSLNMLVNFIKFEYGSEINDIENLVETIKLQIDAIESGEKPDKELTEEEKRQEAEEQEGSFRIHLY